MRQFALLTLALSLGLPACVKVDPLDPTLLTLTNTLTSDGTGGGSSTSGATDDATSNGTGSATTTDPTTGPTTMTSTTEPGTSTTDVGSSSGAASTGGGGGGGYGPCEMSDPPCPDGSDCLMITDVEGNFCSPKCGMTDCPAPTDGTAAPMCVLTSGMGMDPTNCALICDPMKMGECPAGSTCKPIQNVGVCTYP